MNKLPLILTVIGLLAAAVGGFWWYRRGRHLTWMQVNTMIHENFPQVP